MQNIEKYSSEIKEIGDLSRQVQQIQSRLSVQILSDFREIFEKNIKSSIPFNQLSDACKIVSLLNDNTRSDLISWLLSVQLSEYEHLFRETELIAWLDHIDKRYNNSNSYVTAMFFVDIPFTTLQLYNILNLIVFTLVDEFHPVLYVTAIKTAL